MSIDDVLSVVKPAMLFPIKISSDNKWVAFTAEARGVKKAYPGVSSEVDGFTQWVCNLVTGNAMPLVPEATSSWSGTWSPNGKMLAFFSDLNRKAQLWLWNAEDQSLSLASEQIVRPFFGFESPIWTNDGLSVVVKAMPKGDVNQNWFNSGNIPTVINQDISNIKVFSTNTNDEHLMEQVQDQGSMIERYLADIIRIDVESSNYTILAANHYPVGISLSHDGRKIAYSSCKGKINHNQMVYDLWVAPVYSDQKEEDHPYCLQTNIQMSYGLSFSWGKDNKTIYYTTKGSLSNEGLWFIHTDRIGYSELLFEEKKLKLGRDFEAPHGLANGDVLLTAAGKLWRYVNSSKEMIELSSQIHRNVVTFIPIILNNAESDVEEYVLVQTKDSKNPKWGFDLINIDSGKVKNIIEDSRQHLPWYLGGACVTNKDSKPIVVYFSESSSEPPNLWITGLETKEAKKLTDLSSISTNGIGETKILEWIKDDKRVKGILLLPRERQGKMPVLLDVYAGEKVTDFINTFGLHDSPADNRHLFTSRGYAIFMPELPMESHEPAEEIERGLVAALDMLATIPEVDMERLGIMGCSFGGYTTLVGISILPDRFKVAITESGIANLVSYTTHFDPGFDFHFGWAEQGQANMGVSIWENKERYIRNSPIFDFDKVEAAVLIIQGMKDSLCSHEAGPIFSSLRRLKKTAELVLYENEDHCHVSWKYENIKDYYYRVFRWLDKYL